MIDQPLPYLIKTFIPCADHPEHFIYIFYLDTPFEYITSMLRLYHIHSVKYRENYIVVFVDV